ncbi:uncharacterized protein TOT_040000622 [Theileria orientalis strain Shintoku]|uniref:Translation initiation factor IF-2 n=1 Tax=Theileria orientalis strain Shintoku TaxID=869250 RepID=J4CE45_THEOR|nr:uncharacterized protein TOT_040000622 [Theileria orientalis strain Shintoku]BAM42252.1 uncharacterized protein TOT_040000622 [Theileria orientalis strain Shintoku]|eukprot:XP_009692553.1 uncharacterized protein TOT_040000622 [Theileria orientalis strain Shintoku]
MSRYYTKPLSILASNKLHLIPKMSALRLVETMEDISYWKDRRSDSAVKLFTHCSSRLMALLQELKISEMVRMLHTYSKAGIQVQSFIPKIREYVLNDPESEELLFNNSCVNDMILLYKGFEKNQVFDSRIHNFMVQKIIKQKKHMVESDVCLFLRTHKNYLLENTNRQEYEETHSSLESYLFPEFVNEMILRLLKSEIESMELVDSMFISLSKHPEIFDAEQILSLIRSCCKLVQRCYTVNNQVTYQSNSTIRVQNVIFKQDNSAPIEFISSLLGEIERRNDIMEFRSCIESFYHLNAINYWNPSLMKGMIYCIINRVSQKEDAVKIHEIISKNQEKLIEAHQKANSASKEDSERSERESIVTSLEVKRAVEKLKSIINKNNEVRKMKTMYDSFKINLISKTKWKLLTWLYYIFFIKAVLSVGINGRKGNSTPRIQFSAPPLLENKGKRICFLCNNSLKRNNIANVNGSFGENRNKDEKQEGRLNSPAHSFTHHRSQVHQPGYWHSYYNRNDIQAKVPFPPSRQLTRQYNPQFQHTNMYNSTPYPVMNQYQGMGMSYYTTQMTPVIRPVYQAPNMSPVTTMYQMPIRVKPQIEPSYGEKLVSHNMNEFWKKKKERDQDRINRYSSFKFYTDIVWWNDDTDEWPGVTKIKPGEEFDGIIHYYFTPFDALVLLVDKKVEASVSLSDMPEEYSTASMKDLFKIDHLIRFKLKDPLEFDDKGRPKLVPCCASERRPQYTFRSKVRGTPIFFTNNMAVFKLEDNQNFAQVFLVNTGIYLTFPIQYKMKELFKKGETVDLEVLKTPVPPKTSGYSCRIPLDSEKGIELGGKYKMVSEVLTTAGGQRMSEEYSREYKEDAYDLKHEPVYKTPIETAKYFVNEYESLLPYESESCTLREFVRRIRGDLKVVMSYISLKIRGLVNPETTISQTMGKIIINFVKNKKIFEVEREEEEFEFSQFKEQNCSQEDDRIPVVALLGGPEEGKSALFENLCGKEPETESNFNFGKVKHKFPITLFDTPGNELLSPIRDNILKASDMALILISAETGVTKHTLEAISRCKEMKVPFLFVLTKLDESSQENIESVISKLASAGINLEQIGGEYQMISFSTLEDSETNRETLMEAIILQSSISERRKSESDGNAKAHGYVLDSGKSKNQGFYSLLLVNKGTLKKGDNLVNGVASVKIKSIRNGEGELMKELTQSECGYVYGFDKETTAEPGSTFQAYGTEDESDTMTENEENDSVKYVPALVRSDVKAMAEAIKVAVEKLKCIGVSRTCKYKVLEANIGNLKQDDVGVLEGNGLVVACNSPISNTLETKLGKQGIKVVTGDNIVDIVKKVEEELPEYLGEKKLGRLVGTAKILKLFEASKKRKAAGCVVTFGRLEPSYDFRVMRGDKFLYYGKISSLRRTTEEASEILETESCGITFQDFNDFKVGDVIEAYVD